MYSNVFDMNNGGFCAKGVTCAVLRKPNGKFCRIYRT